MNRIRQIACEIAVANAARSATSNDTTAIAQLRNHPEVKGMPDAAFEAILDRLFAEGTIVRVGPGAYKLG